MAVTLSASASVQPRDGRRQQDRGSAAAVAPSAQAGSRTARRDERRAIWAIGRYGSVAGYRIAGHGQFGRLTCGETTFAGMSACGELVVGQRRWCRAFRFGFSHTHQRATLIQPPIRLTGFFDQALVRTSSERTPPPRRPRAGQTPEGQPTNGAYDTHTSGNHPGQRVAPVQMTGAEAVVRSLEELGVDLIFPGSGGAVLPVYTTRCSAPAKLRHVTVPPRAGRRAHGQRLCPRHRPRRRHDGHLRARRDQPIVTRWPTPDGLHPPSPSPGRWAAGLIGTDAFQRSDITGITMPIPSTTSWSATVTTSPARSPGVPHRRHRAPGTVSSGHQGRPGETTSVWPPRPSAGLPGRPCGRGGSECRPS